MMKKCQGEEIGIFSSLAHRMHCCRMGLSDIAYRMQHDAAVESLASMRITVSERPCRNPLLVCLRCKVVRRFDPVGQIGTKTDTGRYIRFDHIYRCTECHDRRGWGCTVERVPWLEVLPR